MDEVKDEDDGTAVMDDATIELIGARPDFLLLDRRPPPF